MIKVEIAPGRAVHLADPVTHDGRGCYRPLCNPTNNFGVKGYGGESKSFYRAPASRDVTCKRCIRITST